MQQNQGHKPGIDFDRVRAIIEPVLRAHGLSLVDLEWGTEHSGWVLRVFIEREDAKFHKSAQASQLAHLAGVTLDDCAQVSNDVSSALDVADLIRHHYHLEVSSPGLDRKLYSRVDFERFEGETAKLKLRRAAPDGQRVLRGKLVAPPGSAPKNHVAVIADGKLISVPYEDVEEARLVFELMPQPKMKKGMSKPKKGVPEQQAGPENQAHPPNAEPSKKKRKS